MTNHVPFLICTYAGFLLFSLFQQTRWLQRVKFIGLIALCVRTAWYVTGAVVWFWSWLYQKMI